MLRRLELRHGAEMTEGDPAVDVAGLTVVAHVDRTTRPLASIGDGPQWVRWPGRGNVKLAR